MNVKRVSMREVAEQANVHIATAWRWALKGARGKQLSSYLVGGRRYVLQSELDAFLNPIEMRSEQPAEEAELATTLLNAAGVGRPSEQDA